MKKVMYAFTFIMCMQVATSIKEGVVAPITHHLPMVELVVPQEARS